jgi:hypothetical protein
MEFGTELPYEIKITCSSNKGFIVKVGCCTCVFSNKEDLLSALKEYLDDPEGMEKKYNEANKGQDLEDEVESTLPDDTEEVSNDERPTPQSLSRR